MKLNFFVVIKKGGSAIIKKYFLGQIICEIIRKKMFLEEHVMQIIKSVI